MPEQITVTRRTYRLRIDPDRPRAWLESPAGVPWSQLSLIAGVDRVGVRDESQPGLTVDHADGTVRVRQPTSAWDTKTVVIECDDDRVRVHVEVTGDGRISDVTLLGGRAILPSGACGVFRSSIGFAGVLAPAPTQPVAVVRDAQAPAVLSVIGDAEPGRLHGIFSPPPLCFGFTHSAPVSPTGVPEGEWLGAWLEGDAAELGFTQFGYQPLDGGFLLGLDYQGHTRVTGRWRSPTLVLHPAPGADALLDAYAAAAAPAARAAEEPAWWRRPIFCGWGAQCARAADRNRGNASNGLVGGATAVSAPALASQDNYDEWLDLLAHHGLRPGTVVIDDKWSLHYGTAEPDPVKWPDLRGWIARQHAADRKVLLWWKAWDPEALPPDMCVTTPHGLPVAVDPGNPLYTRRLAAIIHGLLSPDGLDADGLKVDFTQRVPSGESLRNAEPGCWGIAGLHRLVGAIHDAAKAAKPDALLVTHTVHPAFGDVTDMVRLNDVLEWAADGSRVGVTDQLRFRAWVARHTLARKPLDTDQWPMPTREEWLSYVDEQWRLGVPALYYLETIDNSAEAITGSDLARVARSWQRYAGG